MNTKVIIAVTAVVSFGAGAAAGWFARKKTEVQFVQTTEEDLQAYAAQCEQKKESSEEKQEEEEETPNQPDETHINPGEDARKIDYANAWKQKHDEILHR